ncbi:MAG: polyprenyl synthetase family protein [Bdellovibrio sp.]|nr:polyprenyl synthetase family protein [Bdellovibrio sp.]
MNNIDLDFKKKLTKVDDSLIGLDELSSLLGSEISKFCSEELNEVIFKPIQKFSNKSSNLFRARLVALSISLCSDKTLVFTKQYQKEMSVRFSNLLEALHGGSLIIDDIQDGALTRRGKPSLHTEIGVPLAINSGNWLYFWALSLIEKMELEPRIELAVNRLCHQAMIKGHFGQALDLGVRVDELSQDRARELSISALKLKTGALMSLATELGAVACGVHPEVREALKNFGLNFGYALQSFNDLGEYSLKNDQISQDLLLGRPTWIWICAGEYFSASEYLKFQKQVSVLVKAKTNVQKELMLDLKNHPLIEFSKAQAKKLMSETFDQLSSHLLKFDYELNQRTDWKELQQLAQKVMGAYG